jgi:hypothetical protein
VSRARWRQFLVALVLTMSAGCATEPRVPDLAGTTSSPRDALSRMMSAIEVVPQTSYRPGYDRSCAEGRACVFGELWTDEHPGPFGHNGCDTRQDVLLVQLSDIEMRWGSACRIYNGSLNDPYTGAKLTWRADGYEIQVDHVYPLAAAWHAGAWRWPRRKRLRFANDVGRELLAVGAEANQDKGAQTPAEWLPSNPAGGCEYVRAYLGAALAYELPITAADAAAIQAVGGEC